jgi:hypothetical protein
MNSGHSAIDRQVVHASGGIVWTTASDAARGRRSDSTG